MPLPSLPASPAPLEGTSIDLTPYQIYLLISVVDNGAVRPIPEIRRLRRLMTTLREATGTYIQELDDIAFTHEKSREDVPPGDPVVRQVAILHINRSENSQVAALNAKNSEPITIPLSGVDYAALQKWWKATPELVSARAVRDDILAIDEALGGSEDEP